MWSRPESDEALVRRLSPSTNPDCKDRRHAWGEWQLSIGELALLKFIRLQNNTNEADEDILQEALLAAYLEVESGGYELRAGIPFTAYVKGIARNKIREARRRERKLTSLADLPELPSGQAHRQLETTVEQREQQEALLYGLHALSVQRRQVLERILSGQSTAEIARALAISPELVRQHKCRGLRALARELTANGAAPTAGVPAAGASNRYPV